MSRCSFTKKGRRDVKLKRLEIISGRNRFPSQFRSSDIRKNPAYDVCDCRYRFEVGGFRQYRRPYARARARLFRVLFFLFFFYSFLVFAQTGYLRYFSTRSFVARNDRFFVLLCSVVFHCPYLLSLFLPDAAATPPYFHAFDLTTHVPPPMYFQW